MIYCMGQSFTDGWSVPALSTTNGSIRITITVVGYLPWEVTYNELSKEETDFDDALPLHYQKI